MTSPGDDIRADRLRQAIFARKAARASATELAARPAGSPTPLGDGQRSLWLAHRLDPRSTAYNVASAFLVDGPVDRQSLERAFGIVVARHRILRSTFREDRGTVLQVVHPQEPRLLEVRGAADGCLQAVATEEASRPFDLSTGPLVRLVLVEEASRRRQLLLLVLHHIVADETSLGILWKELAEAHEGRLSAEGPPVQYDDYVHWATTADAPGAAALEYWKRRLGPLPDELRLPFENAAGKAPARGRLIVRPVGPAVAASVRGLAAATGSTPFSVCAFAFRLLLHRYTDGQPVAFATPVSTRSHAATADMVGYFLNPVVVPTAVDETKPVGQAVREFGRELRELLAHASPSFEALSEALSPPRHRDRHPIFQAMFVYQEPIVLPALGGARLEPITLDLGAAKFDLTLFAAMAEGAPEIAVEYRADRYDEAWMQALLDHYEALLEALTHDADRPVAEASMLSAEEERRLRAWAQGGESGTRAITCLPREIRDRARQYPQAPAVVGAGTRLSYGDLERSAGSIARALAASGVGPGHRVGIFVERSPSMIAALVGCHWAGAAYVPLDPAYPAARTRDVLEDAEVAAVLTTSAVRDRLPSGSWPVIDVDRLGAGVGDAGASLDPPPDAPAYILYTSGSTGRPKGVVVTHENLRLSTEARLEVYDSPPTRFLLVPSVAFDSSVAGLFWTLAVGGTLVVPTDAEVTDPRQLTRLIAAERVTSLLCVPSLYAQLIAAGGDQLACLDTAIVAGESCSSRLAEDHFRVLPRTRLFNEYGPTEATVWATVHEVTAADSSRPVAIGRPIPGVRVDVLDPLGRVVPAGIPGHAWIAGPTVADGYWRRPDLTAERFVAGTAGAAARRYRTGDLAAWTTDGRLLFLGREDEQIKLRGFRIEPGDVETALVELPGIAEAAVVARGPAPGAAATELVAFVQAVEGASLPDWRPRLAARLPDHMIPGRLVRLPGLPRLPNGKIDRRRLRDLPLEAEARVGEDRGVPTTNELALLSLWEGLLGRSGVSTTDNFFELGGHSLLVVEMVLAIERDFEVTVSPAEVFEHPTVRELALRIERQPGPRTPGYRHLFPIQPTGRGTPFIVAVPHFFSGMFATRFRGERPVYGLRGVSLRSEGNYGRWPTMTDLAGELVEEIGRRFPGEGCIMAGYSFGASMAFEAVRLMEARGLPVRRLYLIAPMPLDVYRAGPFRVRIDGLRAPLEEYPAAELLRLYARHNHPLTRRFYQRAWRRLAVQPWRHLLCLAGKARTSAGLPLTPRILHADVRVERFRLHTGFRPGRVHTPTVIFNAGGTEADAAATWRRAFAGPLTVHETPDPHDDALVEAARQEILRHLDDVEGA
jgi:amino acid adenylation domain-containing protein